MLPYDSVLNIPPAEALILADTIDNRDFLIDSLLDRIHKKYLKLADEHVKIKDALDANGISVDALLRGEKIEVPGRDVTTTITSTVSSNNNRQICRPFLNRDNPYYNEKKI